jgi:hypothetical protein
MRGGAKRSINKSNWAIRNTGSSSAPAAGKDSEQTALTSSCKALGKGDESDRFSPVPFADFEFPIFLNSARLLVATQFCHSTSELSFFDFYGLVARSGVVSVSVLCSFAIISELPVLALGIDAFVCLLELNLHMAVHTDAME